MTAPARYPPTRARIGAAVTAVKLVSIVLATTHVAGTARADGRSVDLWLPRLRLAYDPGAAFSLGAGLPTWLVLAATALITAGVGFYACVAPRPPRRPAGPGWPPCSQGKRALVGHPTWGGVR